MLIAVIAAVVVSLVAAIAFASSYLLNYAIGRARDGDDRNVEKTMMNMGRVLRSFFPLINS